jgi:hypothetical protein
MMVDKRFALFLSYYLLRNGFRLDFVRCPLHKVQWKKKHGKKYVESSPIGEYMPCNNIPGIFGECVMGRGFDSKRVQAPEIGQKRQAL